MCFSLEMSLVASVALTAAGAFIFHRGFPRKFFFLALMPWLFAFQQGVEAVQWGLWGKSRWAMLIYMFMASCFWNVWIPFSFWWLTTDFVKQQMIAFLGGMGFVSALFGFSLMPELEVNICNFTVLYTYASGCSLFTYYILGGVYVATVFFPFMLQEERKFKVIGGTFFLSALITFYINQVWFISLWCFVAAIFSIGLILIIPKKSS